MKRKGKSPSITYAQSSDIKSRTWLEYRRDMKRKAIAEFEVMEWLEKLLKKQNRGKRVELRKGGEGLLWFRRGGNVSREPDFIATIDGGERKIEFQYADKTNLKYYDFKISKVSEAAPKEKGSRIPKDDVEFLYIDMQKASYALLSASWIVEHGVVGHVPAWRSEGYRVPKETFEQILQPGGKELINVINIIKNKKSILEFHFTLYEQTRNQLAESISIAIEKQNYFSISPDDLKSFFHACFIMDSIEREPVNPNEWLQKAIRFAETSKLPEEVFQATYCLDFLYFRFAPDQPLPHLDQFVLSIHNLIRTLKQWYSPTGGVFRSGSVADACEETRYALFAISCLEDIVQDMVFQYRDYNIPFNPIRRIYQGLIPELDPVKIGEFIFGCNNSQSP